ncbi:MAG: alpha/beta hydrolase [Flavipsychrobacter sp.]|nr:alpha/beta hydrolase [Flavipsychrobacter sp.]
MNTGDYNRKGVRLQNGCEVSYIDEGAGEQCIVFVHGLSNYAMGWRKNIDELKQYYRCIAIDLPGNGYSGRGDYPYSMDFFADCLRQFVEALKLKNVCLCGHSMGGQVVLTATLKYPRLAEKLVLCAPAGFEVFNSAERSLYMTSIQLFDIFSSEENSLRKVLQNSFYLFPGQAREMVDELTMLLKAYPLKEYRAMIEACVYGMLHEPVFDRLHEIMQPTLVLYGERDALIPTRALHPVPTRQIAEQGTNRIPAAELHMLPRCGHFLQWEKANDVNYYMRQFLSF